MTLNGKTPAVILLPEGDVITLYNDVVSYDVEPLELKSFKNDEEPLLMSLAPTTKNRCLMFVRSQSRKVIEPVRFVGMSSEKHLNVTELEPFYEVINPEVQSVVNSGSAFLVFWTNFTDEVLEYESDKVLKFEQDSLESAFVDGQDVYRALCSTTITFKKFYVSGGEIATTLGEEPTLLDENIKNRYDIIPIASKPNILQIYKDDYPIVDFASGGGGGIGGMRRHDHRDNSNFGFAFSVFHPGTGIPMLPWEA